MRYYCTLFDSNYIHKGLALYESLVRVNETFHLYILAFDAGCAQILGKLRLDHTTIVRLGDFETEELLLVKPTRNRAEYCWTSGPSLIYYCIQEYNLSHCTYLDADMMFYSNTDDLFHEIADSSIALTEHFINGNLEGKYCVQFVFFKNDIEGLKALTWWRDRCLEWCFARFEDGKYGDQKYLDSIPLLFKNVHIVKHRGAGVAPWNMNQYEFYDDGLFRYKDIIYKIIFFHYHGTRIEFDSSKLILRTITYDVTSIERRNVFIPYLELIRDVYIKYLDRHIISYRIIGQSWDKKCLSFLKRYFRNISFVRYIYFNLFKIRYNGYENNKA